VNHAEVHSYMADYLEGDLDLTKRALVDAHLDGCSDCSGEFAEMRRTIHLLRGLETPEPPPFLVETVMRRIREGEGELRFGDRLRAWARGLATPAVALPATALGLGLLMATGNLDPGLLSLEDAGTPARVRTAPDVGELLAIQDGEAARLARPLHVPAAARPPAVGQVPRITITLPLPGPASSGNAVASSELGVGPFYRRSAPRSIRNVVPMSGSGSGLSTNVSNLAGGVSAQASAFTADANATGLTAEERRWKELDDRLERLIRDPAAFSAEFASYSQAEQELWLEALAERARETGRGDEAVDGLSLSGDRSARQLATALSVELQRQQAAPPR